MSGAHGQGGFLEEPPACKAGCDHAAGSIPALASALVPFPLWESMAAGRWCPPPLIRVDRPVQGRGQLRRPKGAMPVDMASDQRRVCAGAGPSAP